MQIPNKNPRERARIIEHRKNIFPLFNSDNVIQKININKCRNLVNKKELSHYVCAFPFIQWFDEQSAEAELRQR